MGWLEIPVFLARKRLLVLQDQVAVAGVAHQPPQAMAVQEVFPAVAEEVVVPPLQQAQQPQAVLVVLAL